MTRSRGFLVFFALLLSCHAVWATSKSRTELTCPVCARTFPGWVINSTNTFGGVDFDGCPSARGESHLPYIIHTCPQCLFSDDREAFTATGSAPLKKDRQAALEVIRAQAPDSHGWQPWKAWHRCEIAARLATARQDTPQNVGNLLLIGAWCCRQAGCDHTGTADQEGSLPPCGKFLAATNHDLQAALAMIEQSPWRKPLGELNPAQKTLEQAAHLEAVLQVASFTPGQRRALEWFTINRLRDRGELDWTERRLQQLEASSPPLGPDEVSEVRAIRSSMAQERRLMQQAVLHLAPSLLEPKETPVETVGDRIRLADLYRRAGETGSATALLKEALLGDDLHEYARQVAEIILRLMGVPFEIPAAVRERQQARYLALLVKTLRDPQEGRQVPELLRSFPVPDRVASLVLPLLDDPDPEIRIRAALSMPVPDRQVHDTLLTLLESEASPDDQLLSAFRKIPDPAAVPVLAAKLPVTTDSWKKGMILKTIAVIGGPEANEIILREAREALSPRRLAADDQKEHSSYCFHVIGALGVTDEPAAFDILQTVLAATEPRHIVQHHGMAGAALENLANRDFGFQMPVSSAGIQLSLTHAEYNQRTASAPAVSLAWYRDHRGRPRSEWVASGFADAGFKVAPASDPLCLPELIRGLTDRRQYIRYNSYLELVERTGFDPDRSEVRNSPEYYIHYPPLAARFQAWYDRVQATLRWDPERHRFTGTASATTQTGQTGRIR